MLRFYETPVPLKAGRDLRFASTSSGEFKITHKVKSFLRRLSGGVIGIESDKLEKMIDVVLDLE